MTERCPQNRSQLHAMRCRIHVRPADLPGLSYEYTRKQMRLNRQPDCPRKTYWRLAQKMAKHSRRPPLPEEKNGECDGS